MLLNKKFFIVNNFFKKNALLCSENIDNCPVVHYILYSIIPEPFMTRGTIWKSLMKTAKK